jgi:hypothetical protein
MAIGDINVVAEATDTLTKLLAELDVTLDSPADLKDTNGSFQKINLYLYQVLEHAFAKNQPRVALDDRSLQSPPLTLSLYYLLTPYASDALSAHKVLGHAMRIFYDNAIITDAALTDSLRLATDRLSIVLLSTKLEDLTRIWNALQTPYRLSVCYEVRVVPIESARVEQTQRVTSRTNVYGSR